MSARLPPLGWIRAFEAAGRHLSFTRAAAELNVTQAAVSQQVKALEELLEIALFRRVRNRLFLTYAGQAWLPKVSAGFALIEGGLASARVYDSTTRLRERGGIVTVQVPSSFSIQWLAPRLADFHERFPQIDVRLTALNRRDLGAPSLEIRNGGSPGPGLAAQLLLREEVFPVCSPAFFTRHRDQAGGVEWLARQTLLHVNGYAETWDGWFAAAGVRQVQSRPGGLHFDQSVTAIQSAINSIGVALGRSALVDREVRLGRLMVPVDLRLEAKDAYWIVTPDRAEARAPQVETFRAWLLEEAASAG